MRLWRRHDEVFLTPPLRLCVLSQPPCLWRKPARQFNPWGGVVCYFKCYFKCVISSVFQVLILYGRDTFRVASIVRRTPSTNAHMLTVNKYPAARLPIVATAVLLISYTGCCQVYMMSSLLCPCLLPGVGKVNFELNAGVFVVHLYVSLNFAGDKDLDRSPVQRIRSRHGTAPRDGVHHEVIGGGVKQPL